MSFHLQKTERGLAALSRRHRARLLITELLSVAKLTRLVSHYVSIIFNKLAAPLPKTSHGVYQLIS